MTAQRSQQGSGTPILYRALQTERSALFASRMGLPGSRDHPFESTPHPAYGSELSTGGGRLVRALTAMEPTRHPFPVSSTARTIGEQKAKVNTFHCYFTEVH